MNNQRPIYFNARPFNARPQYQQQQPQPQQRQPQLQQPYYASAVAPPPAPRNNNDALNTAKINSLLENNSSLNATILALKRENVELKTKRHSSTDINSSLAKAQQQYHTDLSNLHA